MPTLAQVSRQQILSAFGIMAAVSWEGGGGWWANGGGWEEEDIT